MHRIIKPLIIFLEIFQLMTLISCSGTDIRLTSNQEGLSTEERHWNKHKYDMQGWTLKTYPKNPAAQAVQGVCLIKDVKKQTDDYCNAIELVLEDQNQRIIAITKTRTNGTFTFNNIKLGHYQLNVREKHYRKLSDVIFVSPGSEVLIHLQKVDLKQP